MHLAWNELHSKRTQPVYLDDGLTLGENEVRDTGRNDHEGTGFQRGHLRDVERLADSEAPFAFQDCHVLVPRMDVRGEPKTVRQANTVGDRYGLVRFAFEHRSLIARRVAWYVFPLHRGGLQDVH